MIPTATSEVARIPNMKRPPASSSSTITSIEFLHEIRRCKRRGKRIAQRDPGEQ
jgi:hypothetical protein